MGSTGLVRYFSQIGPGQREQIDLTIFTTSANSTLYIARDGPIQVSIVLQVEMPISIFYSRRALERTLFDLDFLEELLSAVRLSKWRRRLHVRLSRPGAWRSMAHLAMPEDVDDRTIPSSDRCSALSVCPSLLQLDLTFDYETRHYTNLTGYFSLFGDKKIQICGTNFFGYVQDVRVELLLLLLLRSDADLDCSLGRAHCG